MLKALLPPKAVAQLLILRRLRLTLIDMRLRFPSTSFVMFQRAATSNVCAEGCALVTKALYVRL